MSNSKWAKIIVLVLMLPSMVLSQKLIKPKNIQNSKWETWFDKVPVSGEIRVGAMVEYSNYKVNPSSFWVYIPVKKEPILCVEISSSDGRYEANLEYDLSLATPGYNNFELPTKHINNLNKYHTKDISILAKGTSNCSSETYFFYVSSWNKPPKSDSIYIMLNSENPTKVSYVDRSGTSAEIDCKKIQTQNSIAYNCLCVLPKNEAMLLEQCAIIQRIKKGSVRKTLSYPFPIKL